MSDSGRSKQTTSLNGPAIFLLSALALTFLVAFVNVAQHRPSAEQRYYSSECDTADERYRTLVDVTLPRALNAQDSAKAVEIEKKAREQVAHWCDLAAQQNSAEAAVFAAKQSLWVTMFTGMGVVLIAGTLLYTAKAFKEAESATDAIVKDLRPWLKISSFGIDSDDYLPFVTLQNVGKSPAVEVEIRAVIIARPEHTCDFSERIRIAEQCASQEIDHAVLPGDTGRFIMEYLLHTHREDGADNGAHIYCILIDYKGVGCENGRSFGLWHSLQVPSAEPDLYEEDERARQYS